MDNHYLIEVRTSRGLPTVSCWFVGVRKVIVGLMHSKENWRGMRVTRWISTNWRCDIQGL